MTFVKKAAIAFKFDEDQERKKLSVVFIIVTLNNQNVRNYGRKPEAFFFSLRQVFVSCSKVTDIKTTVAFSSPFSSFKVSTAVSLP